MDSLFDYLEGIYKQLLSMEQLDFNTCNIIKDTKFIDLINDDKKCIELISSVLEFPMEAISINRHRASHIIVTWILGIGLSNFAKAGNNLTGFAYLYESRLWLQTAIIHDYGYFCREIRQMLALESIIKAYNLLTDTYNVVELTCLNDLSRVPDFECFFSYTYKEIKDYYCYIQKKHAKMIKNISSDSENIFDDVSDHGIVGGCKAFNKYCRYIVSLNGKANYGPSDVITKIQKVSCIIAASHNIFKANPRDNKDYVASGLEGLTSISPARITRTNFLLLLLSLVDTIECTKRFSKKENPHEYLLQSTILDHVYISVKSKEIQIDFSQLDSFILNKRKSTRMKQTMERHIEAIAGLDDWTDFHATRSPTNEKLIIITLKS